MIVDSPATAGSINLAQQTGVHKKKKKEQSKKSDRPRGWMDERGDRAMDNDVDDDTPHLNQLNQNQAFGGSKKSIILNPLVREQ